MADKQTLHRASRKRAFARKSQKQIPEPRPRIIVKFLDDYQDLPYTDDVEDYLEQHHIIPWGSLKEKYPGIDMRRLYTSVSPERIKELVAQAVKLDDTYKPPNFLTYFLVDVPAGVNPDELTRVFLEFPSVEAAYVDPPLAAPSPAVNYANNLWSYKQGYLDAAPGGIDAKYAWSLGGGYWGGDGDKQDFIDFEQGWTFEHLDLPTRGKVPPEQPLVGDNIDGERQHGTRVLGVVCGVDNSIGIVGIAPHVRSVKGVSFMINGQVDRPDAFMISIASLPFGGVLLLEADVSGTGYPLDVLKDTRATIRLATALGITVVEAAGNQSKDLDSYTETEKNAAGTLITIHPLNPNLSQEFRDSGAIMVAAGSSGYPHSRCSFSNYGSRIDCYAWGENVYTTDSQPNTSPPPQYTINGYTPLTDLFNGTSSAAAIIAGAALAVQGFAETHLRSRFNARKMRSLLGDKLIGTPSNAPPSQWIGVMPNLRALLDAINVAPDVYIRDFVGDTGDPHTGAISASPDVILRQALVPNPTAAFGQGSGWENSDTLGDVAKRGQDNYIYVRMQNRGSSAALNVTATVYWAPPATLVTPHLWTLVGQVVIPIVPFQPLGQTLTVSDPIVWPSAQIPGWGHYCFVCLIGNDADPAPVPADFKDWNNYQRFIRDNNNVTWRNFNIVGNIPAASGFVPLPFLAPGAPDKERLMRLEVVADLPEGSRIFLQMPQAMYKLMRKRGRAEIDKKRKNALLPVNPHGVYSLGDMFFKAKSRARLLLLVHVPEEYRNTHYEVFVRQMYQEQEMGRVTWRLAPLGDKETGAPKQEKDKN